MISDGGGFELGEERIDAAMVLRPVGELDVSVAPVVRDRLVVAVRDGVKVLVIDCAGLAFLDSSGLSLLAHAHMRMREAGGELRLAAVPERVTRVLALSGLDQLLRRYDGVQAALSGASA